MSQTHQTSNLSRCLTKINTTKESESQSSEGVSKLQPGQRMIGKTTYSGLLFGHGQFRGGNNHTVIIGVNKMARNKFDTAKLNRDINIT